MKNHHGFDTLEIFPPRAFYPSLLPCTPILIRISVTSPTPCGFLPRLALLLVTLFLNFVAASPTNCAYELIGPCTKFRETCPGKWGFPGQAGKKRTPMRPSVRQQGRCFSPATVWFIQKVGDVHLVALKAQLATKYLQPRSRIASLAAAVGVF